MSKELEALERLKDRADHDEYLFRQDTNKEKSIKFLDENNSYVSSIEQALKENEQYKAMLLLHRGVKMSKGLVALKNILNNDKVFTMSSKEYSENVSVIEDELKENVKYKTTEEKLGISIFTLVEVGQKCFFRHYDEIKFVDKNIEVDFKEKRILIYYNPFSDNPLAFPFSDYGKSFASTREELEK